MPALVRHHTTQPSPDMVRRNDRWAKILVPPTRTWLGVRYQQLSVEGRVNVPMEEPCLILANHVALTDPLSVLLTAPRYAQFMATQSLFNGGLGRILAWWGVVPKKKFTVDAKAVRLLKGWTDSGSPVALFPEGQRTWDGHPLPLLDGIEKLVRLLGAPVVTARIYNADRVWPRWAPRPRRGRVHVIFDPPRTFERREDPRVVREYIQERIRVDPTDCPRFPVRGDNLAVGLSNVLFACPSCHAVEALREKGDRLGCQSCGGTWEVDTANRLRPEGSGEVMSIADAYRAVRTVFAERDWVADLSRFEADGVVLESEPVQLHDVTDDSPVPVGTGRLRLTPQEVRLVGDTEWAMPLEAVRSVSAEQRDRLYLFTKDRCFEPIMTDESVVKWEHVSEHWRRKVHAEQAVH